MGKDWDYAELSSDAKDHGGPDQFREDLREEGYDECEKDVLIALAAIMTAGVLVKCVVVPRIKTIIKKCRKAKADKKNEDILQIAENDSIIALDTKRADTYDEETGSSF